MEEKRNKASKALVCGFSQYLKDLKRGYAYLNVKNLKQLQVRTGDLVLVESSKTSEFAVAIAWPLSGISESRTVFFAHPQRFILILAQEKMPTLLLAKQ